MRIHQLRAQAFGPFAEEVAVDVDALSDAGLFLLTGATGAGKTSVLDAICFALYGAVPGDRQAARRLRSDRAADGVPPEVSLEFTVQGRRFLIDRSPGWQRPKKRGSGLTTEQPSVLVRERVEGEWLPLTTRLDEAGHLVTGLLGMNLTQFCQVQLLPQGRFQAFLRADSHERHQLLQQLFRTSRFEDVETWLRERRRVLRRESGRHHEVVADLVSRISEAADERLPETWDPHGLGPAVVEVPVWAEGLRSAATAAEQDAAAFVMTATAEAESAGQQLEDARRLHERRERLARARREESVLAAEEPAQAERVRRLEAARRAASVLPLADVAARAEAEHVAARAAAVEALAVVAPLIDDPSPSLPTVRARGALAVETAARARTLLPRVADRDRLAALVRADEGRTDEIEAELGRVAAELAELPDVLTRQREHEQAAARAAESVPVAERELAGVRARRDAARQVAALEAQRVEADDLLREAVDHTQAVTAHWLDLQELRLTGMAAEIAGALAVGACCPVCGSADHPQLADSRPGAPDADAVREARREVDDAEVLRQARTGAVADLRVQIANAGERAGGSDAGALELALTEQADRCDRLRDEAAGVPAARTAREATEAALAGLHARSTALVAERAGLVAGLAERRARIAALTDELDALLAGTRHDTVPALAAHSDAVAEACARAVQSVEVQDQRALATVTATTRARDAAERHGFTDLSGVRSAALADSPRAGLERLVRTQQSRRAAVAALLSDPDLAPAVDTVAPDLPALEAAEEGAALALARARDAQAAAGRRCARLAALGAELATAMSAWAPLRDQVDLTDRLASLADGSAPDNRWKMRLSGYVLAFRLRQVVAAANERLVSMTDGRYRLEHTGDRGAGESRGGLSLLVRDDWSGEARDPVTLSGGETFVVSLALALGLADVIAHEAGGAELDTLFVDEGFGTLDADTLDDVMDTLDSLRDGGRVVGVVSHVAELRDRIPTQLQVRKHRSGSTVHQESVG